MVARSERGDLGLDPVQPPPGQVVHVHEAARSAVGIGEQVEGPAAEHRALHRQHALHRPDVIRFDGEVGGDLVGPAPHVDRHRLGHGHAPGPVRVAVPGRHGGLALEHELGERPVVEREHAVALGFGPPQVDQLGEQLGPVGGEVVALRRVGAQVVELPRRPVQPRFLRLHLVVGDRLHAVAVDGPAAEHLGVLDRVVLGGVGVGEGSGEARAVERLLGDAGHGLGRGDADEVEHGGQDVDRVHVLVAHPAPLGRGDARRPVHDQRIGHPALVGLALPPLERRVARHRPAPRVVVVEPGAADLVDAPGRLLHGAGERVPHPPVVERPRRSALGRRPVVGQDDDHRVLELAQLGQAVDEAAQLVVRVRQVRRERLHVAGVDRALDVAQVVPRRHPLGPGRQLGVRREQPLGDLLGQRRLPPRVPAAIEPSPVPLEPLGRRVVRRVASAGGEVAEPGLVDVDVAQVLHVLDRPVHQVDGEVVPLLERARWLDEVVVVHERRHELVRLPGEEPVEPLEAPTQRPAVPPGPQVLLVLRRQVPLADGPRRVPVGYQHRRRHRARRRDAGVVAGEPGRQVDDATHADPVVVAPGEHARPGGGAQRRRVEVGVAQAVGRQPVERRRLDVGPEAAQLGVAHIVEHHDQHVRRTLGRARLRRPPGLGLPVVAPDGPLELADLHGT